MRMQNAVMVLSFSLGLVGCSLLKPIDIPTPKSYVLSRIPERVKVHKKVHPESVTVLTPIANPGYQRRNITYMKTPYQLQHYALHQWVAPPNEMVRTVLSNTLRMSKRFFSVIEQPQHATTHFRLASRLQKFQQELFTKTPRVRVALKVDLIDNRDSKIIASKLFEVIQEVETADPYHAVLGFNSAMAELAGYVSDFVMRYV